MVSTTETYGIKVKERFKQLYMDFASRVAQMSYAKRLQVGAIIVKDDRVISIGYNGMPAGWDNNCETKEYMGPAGIGLKEEQIKERWPHIEWGGEFSDQRIYYSLKTKPEVLHAESNALAKLAKSTESGEGSALFVTHSPCIDCAKLILQSGISNVYYSENYRDNSGIDFLKKSGITVEKVCGT